MDGDSDALFRLARRRFFGRTAGMLGAAALASLHSEEEAHATEKAIGALHFAPRAKRVIYLFQSGGPSHLELLDYKPKLAELQESELPDSIRPGQRLTGMTSGQKSFPVIFQVQVFATRPIGRLAQRAVAAHREAGGPALHYPLSRLRRSTRSARLCSASPTTPVWSF